jgi:hypothetical protein
MEESIYFEEEVEKIYLFQKLFSNLEYSHLAGSNYIICIIKEP